MNHLVVFAHPNPKSFGKAILDTVVKASEEKGVSVRIRDLYALGFDPILKPADFEAFQSGRVPQDIADEQQHIIWAEVVTFIYPVWWTSLPAMLKGYVDRVFSYGFAYESVNGNINGLLKGKRALVFSTTGSPSKVYEENGMFDSMIQTTGQGIFNFCGMNEVSHTFFGAVPYVTDEERKNFLEEVKNVINEHF